MRSILVLILSFLIISCDNGYNPTVVSARKEASEIGVEIMKREWHYEYQGLEEPTEYGVSLIDQLTPFEYGDDKWTLKSKGSLILDHGAVYISPSFDAYEDTKIVAIVIYDIGGV